MTQIGQRPDQTEEEFWAEVDPYDDRLSHELPRWSCCLILLALLAVIAFGLYRLAIWRGFSGSINS